MDLTNCTLSILAPFILIIPKLQLNLKNQQNVEKQKKFRARHRSSQIGRGSWTHVQKKLNMYNKQIEET
jgi:hypothetical protein